MSSKFEIDEAALIEAVEKCNSVAEVMRYLDYSVSGVSHKIFKNKISAMGLTFKKVRKTSTPRLLEEYLVLDGPPIKSSELKNKLLKTNVLEYKCSMSYCGISDWHGQKISLQLDHIDGNRRNNQLENLRLLCPNCHTQTETWGFKKGHNNNKDVGDKDSQFFRPMASEKVSLVKKRKTTRKSYCVDCNCEILYGSHRCKTCNYLNRVGSSTKYPELDVLIKMVESQGYEATGREIGVTGNAIKKHFRNVHNLEYMPKYINKKQRV